MAALFQTMRNAEHTLAAAERNSSLGFSAATAFGFSSVWSWVWMSGQSRSPVPSWSSSGSPAMSGMDRVSSLSLPLRYCSNAFSGSVSRNSTPFGCAVAMRSRSSSLNELLSSHVCGTQ